MTKVRIYFERIVLWSLTLYLIFLMIYAHCNASEILELNELTLNYRNYSALNPHARNFITYPDPPKEGIDLGFKSSILSLGYLEPTVESLTTTSQYRGIGLQLRLGVGYGPVQAGVYHHSQHGIDRPVSTLPKYPSEDAVEIRLYLYRRDK